MGKLFCARGEAPYLDPSTVWHEAKGDGGGGRGIRVAETKILAPVAKVFTFANKKLKQTIQTHFRYCSHWNGKCSELKFKFLWLHSTPASGGVWGQRGNGVGAWRSIRTLTLLQKLTSLLRWRDIGHFEQGKEMILVLPLPTMSISLCLEPMNMLPYLGKGTLQMW